jgi:hypothetical protein
MPVTESYPAPSADPFLPPANLLPKLFAHQLEYVGQLADEASARSDPWSGLSDFLESILALQAEYRGLMEYMAGPHGEERAGASTARLTPVVAELLARAKASGQVRRDVTVHDVALVPVMVGAVLERCRDTGPPDTWRRMLAVLLDGFRAPGSPLPGRPLDAGELHRVLSS